MIGSAWELSYPLADLDRSLTPHPDDSTHQTMSRSLLRPTRDRRIQMFQLVIPELGEDVSQQRYARVIRLSQQRLQRFQLTNEAPPSAPSSSSSSRPQRCARYGVEG